MSSKQMTQRANDLLGLWEDAVRDATRGAQHEATLKAVQEWLTERARGLTSVAESKGFEALYAAATEVMELKPPPCAVEAAALAVLDADAEKAREQDDEVSV